MTFNAIICVGPALKLLYYLIQHLKIRPTGTVEDDPGGVHPSSDQHIYHQGSKHIPRDMRQQVEPLDMLGGGPGIQGAGDFWRASMYRRRAAAFEQQAISPDSDGGLDDVSCFEIADDYVVMEQSPPSPLSASPNAQQFELEDLERI